MSDTFIQSLQITALGMGLVFGAIIVLWLMMILLTGISADKASASESAPAAPPYIPPNAGGETGRATQAAAIAVATALADQEVSSAHPLPEPPTAIVSAWQLGMRTRLLTQKGSLRRR